MQKMVRGLDDGEREQRRQAAASLMAAPPADDLTAVALTWVDTSGITRTKAVPFNRLDDAAQWGVGMSPVFDAFLVDDSIVTGRFAGGPIGDLRLHPVLSRLVPLAAMPGWAWAPAERFTQEGAAHPIDARWLLSQEVERLEDMGLGVLTAFEVEWAVSEKDGSAFVPACTGPAYGMTRIAELSDYLRDVLRALEASSVSVVQIHPEYAAGQFELSVAHEDPVGSADTLVLVKETIRAVSFRYGLSASFSPKVLADSVGNGAHVHLSLWQQGSSQPRVNAMAGGEGPCGMRRQGEAFTAGVLEHLPALLAVGAPSVASYMRLIPSHWAGAFACWGLENREAALRFVQGPAGRRDQAANLEVKCFDGAANPYLALAALLAAGRAGVDAGAVLPDPVNDVDPALLDAHEREARGIRALPSALEESVAAFETDAVLREAFGEALIDTVAVVRRGEIALFADSTPEEIAAAVRRRH
jgi:glutamine synthetase